MVRVMVLLPMVVLPLWPGIVKAVIRAALLKGGAATFTVTV
jgi:hypothetical protein